MTDELNIAEIPFDTGEIQFRYSRYLSDDGAKWIRHGLFQAFHRNGVLATEGHYVHGREHGTWRDFHENGRLAAEGRYEEGVEADAWRYWDADGAPE